LFSEADLWFFRLIHDLSFPKGNSINSHIPSENSAVQYDSIDPVIKLIKHFGRHHQVHIQVREVLVELAYVLAVFVPVALLTVLVQSSWGCGPLQNLHACLYGIPLGANLSQKMKNKIWSHEYIDLKALVSHVPEDNISLTLSQNQPNHYLEAH
jgi:hypothetical protein